MKFEIQIKRGDITFICDEVSCNLSQEEDKSVGGEKIVMGKHDQTHQTSCCKDSHFTCVGITIAVLGHRVTHVFFLRV